MEQKKDRRLIALRNTSKFMCRKFINDQTHTNYEAWQNALKSSIEYEHQSKA